MTDDTGSDDPVGEVRGRGSSAGAGPAGADPPEGERVRRSTVLWVTVLVLSVAVYLWVGPAPTEPEVLPAAGAPAGGAPAGASVGQAPAGGTGTTNTTTP